MICRYPWPSIKSPTIFQGDRSASKVTRARRQSRGSEPHRRRFSATSIRSDGAEVYWSGWEAAHPWLTEWPPSLQLSYRRCQKFPACCTAPPTLTSSLCTPHSTECLLLNPLCTKASARKYEGTRSSILCGLSHNRSFTFCSSASSSSSSVACSCRSPTWRSTSGGAGRCSENMNGWLAKELSTSLAPHCLPALQISPSYTQ